MRAGNELLFWSCDFWCEWAIFSFFSLWWFLFYSTHLLRTCSVVYCVYAGHFCIRRERTIHDTYRGTFYLWSKRRYNNGYFFLFLSFLPFVHFQNNYCIFMSQIRNRQENKKLEKIIILFHIWLKRIYYYFNYAVFFFVETKTNCNSLLSPALWYKCGETMKC